MIRPLRNNVVLKPSEKQQENRIGIIVTNSVNNEATIVAVGMDVKELKVGDVVRYDTNSAVTLEQYKMCRESDVLCIIE